MIKNHAVAYATKGWSVFPLYGVEGGICQCADPDCSSPGKHPSIAAGVNAATTDKRTIDMTFREGNNLAIATGMRSGIWVLDIDGPAGEKSLLELQQKYGEIPATLEHRTGRGRHLIFALDGEKVSNSVKRLGDGIDVRGDGGYIVAAPSLHVTGKAYRMGEGEPLPAPEWLVDLVRKKDRPAPRPAAMNHEMTGDQVSGMLSFISPDVDYHTWIEIGMALHSEGYSLDVWENWSQTGSKYRQGDCYRRWAGFDKSAGITMGSLWYHAELGGWTPALLDNEVAIDTSAADAFIASALAKQNRTGKPNKIDENTVRLQPSKQISENEFDDIPFPDLQVARQPMTGPSNEPAERASTFPIKPMDLPGVIGDTVRWIVKSAIRPQPEIALMNTLAALGAVFGRRYTTEWDTRCNVYIACIAGTGAGKDHSRKQIKKLMKDAGLHDFLAGDSIVSGPGMLRGLSSQPAQILHLDEFGMLLKSITDDKAPAHLRHVAKALTEIYTASSSLFHGGHYASPDIKPIIIDKPALSIFGTSTLAVYSDALTSSAIGSGELNRFLVVPADDDLPKRSRNVETPAAPIQLVRRWREFAEVQGDANTGNLVEIAGGNVVAPEALTVRWDGVLERLHAIGDTADDRARKAKAKGQTGVWTRYCEQVIKIAMISAIARNPIAPEIEDDDLDLAEAIVMYACKFVVRLADHYISDTKSQKEVKSILAYLRDRGGWVTKTDIARHVDRMPARQRNEILHDLATVREDIVMRVDKSSTGGRPSVSYKIND